MSKGVDWKRRRAVSDWVLDRLEGRVLLSQANGAVAAPSAEVAVRSSGYRTAITLQASTQVGTSLRPSVTLVATVNAPGLHTPVHSGRVRFEVLAPNAESLGFAYPDTLGNATLRTSRLRRGGSYEVEAQFSDPQGVYASSTARLDVPVSPPLATVFRIRAPQYYGAPGTPITFSVTATAGRYRRATSYTGTVRFVSPTDHAAKFAQPTYTFTTADQGRHTFVNGVTFSKGGAEVLKVSQLSNTKITNQQVFGIE